MGRQLKWNHKDNTNLWWASAHPKDLVYYHVNMERLGYGVNRNVYHLSLRSFDNDEDMEIIADVYTPQATLADALDFCQKAFDFWQEWMNKEVDNESI